MGTGFLLHVDPHFEGVVENASTMMRRPFDALLRVASTMIVTRFTLAVLVNTDDRRTVRGEYWSSVRTRFPFTKIAALPLVLVAVYQSAKVGPFTVNTAVAPVTEAMKC